MSIPRAEWNQMYHEVWRIERDFLYDPNHHGLNIPATEKKYSAYLSGSRRTRRSELSCSWKCSEKSRSDTCSSAAETCRSRRR